MCRGLRLISLLNVRGEKFLITHPFIPDMIMLPKPGADLLSPRAILLAAFVISITTGPFSPVSAQTSPDGVNGPLNAGIVFSEADDQGRYRFLVRFNQPGALERYRSLRSRAAGFHISESLTRSLLEEVTFEQEMAVSLAARTLGRDLVPSHHFMVSYSGLAVRLTPEEADRLRTLPNVVAVERERVEEIQTHRGPVFIGADAMWSGVAVPGGAELRGEGMVVAILDSGIFSRPARHPGQ